MVAMLCKQQKSMEFPDEPVGPSLRVLQMLTDCTADLSLYAAFMETTEYSADIVVEREPVPIEDAALPEHRIN